VESLVRLVEKVGRIDVVASDGQGGDVDALSSLVRLKNPG